MRLIPSLLATGLAVGVASAQPADKPDADTKRWWSHVEELGADTYEGRSTGTAGYLRAATYVARQLQRSGLRPAGTSGYFQPVPLIEQRIVTERSSVSLTTGRGTQPLVLGRDIQVIPRFEQPGSINARLVFIGYGLDLPGHPNDDFANMDLRGKVVVYLDGAPKTLSADLRMQARMGFYRALERSGALGAIGIRSPARMSAWTRSVATAPASGYYLADRTMRNAAGPLFVASLNPKWTPELFAGAAHSLEDVLALMEAGKPLPRFSMAGAINARLDRRTRAVQSPNVAAVLPGSDPAKAREFVVLTAHLDAFGRGPPINGDQIYNGVMDNAIGVATLLETARTLASTKARPRRSILFVAVTGEERGHLGSRWFARRPTVPQTALVANVNVDMFLPISPLRTIAVLGETESNLGKAAHAAAASAGVKIIPDQQPERLSLIHSDQYSFIAVGIPALMPKFASPPGTPEAEAIRDHQANRNHAPSDDFGQVVDYGAAEAFNAFIAQLVRRVADQPQRPAWHETSFYRRYASERPPR